MILGDSLLQNLDPLKDTDIVSFRGAKIEDLQNIISLKSSFINYSSVLFLIGANNLINVLILSVRFSLYLQIWLTGLSQLNLVLIFSFQPLSLVCVTTPLAK